MRVFILYASQRSGVNSIVKLVKAFLQGISKKTKFSLFKAQVNPCRGCFNCWEKTPGKCGVTDNMQKIIAGFLEAELVIWCFPMYYYGAPSIMKTFIERLTPYYKLSDKKNTANNLLSQGHVIISTCGFSAEEKNYEAEIKQFDTLFAGKYTKILCPQGELFNIPQMRTWTDKYLQLVLNAGLEYITCGSFSEKTKQMLSMPLLANEDFAKIKNSQNKNQP